MAPIERLDGKAYRDRRFVVIADMDTIPPLTQS